MSWEGADVTLTESAKKNQYARTISLRILQRICDAGKVGTNAHSRAEHPTPVWRACGNNRGK